jgi:hypothetical protein
MNRAWHERHPMPKKAAAELRLRWHMAHQNACGCAPIPAGVIAALAAVPRRPRKTSAKRKR